MELARKVEPLETLMENMPPVEQLPVYAGGLLRLLQAGLRIRLASALHKEEIAEQGPDYFNGVEAAFFRQITEYIFKQMDWDMEIEGKLPETPGGRWVYIMNHPSLLATWPPLDLAGRYMAPHTATTAKSDIMNSPISRFLIGQPLEDIGRVGFIKRPVKPEDREEAYENVRSAVQKLLRPDTGLIIFPDTHRPYPSKIKKAREEWDKKKPDAKVNEWMTETCFPRSGGLWNLLNVTESKEDVRYMDFTVAEPRKKRDSFHVALKEVTREEILGREASEAHLQNWLIENWIEKNRKIREWRNGGR